MTQKQFSGIAELERLVALKGQGASVETYQDQPGINTYRLPPSDFRDIRREIYNVVYGAGQPISRASIAKELKVNKTPWLLAHLERLVTEGYLVKTQGQWRTGALMYFYEVQR